MSGLTCWELNRGDAGFDFGSYGYGAALSNKVFRQNIGGDAMPTFCGQEVTKSGSSFANKDKEVRVDYRKGYGTVTGGGAYTSGKVVMKAEPAEGCLFDHFEVTQPKTENKSMNEGEHPYPSTEVKTYKESEIVLTESIDRSYTVKAVFNVYDEVPAELRQKVKIELECTDDADGWNSSTIPVYLIDSAEEKHLWEVSRKDLDSKGEKVSHTFDIGAASPVVLEAWPDFGGGVTFRSYGLKAKLWLNDAGKAIESKKVTIRSWPFVSSKYGQDYMDINLLLTSWVVSSSSVIRSRPRVLPLKANAFLSRSANSSALKVSATKVPSTPDVTQRTSPTSVTTIGQLQAMASFITLGDPSFREVMIRTSAAHM